MQAGISNIYHLMDAQASYLSFTELEKNIRLYLHTFNNTEVK